MLWLLRSVSVVGLTHTRAFILTCIQTNRGLKFTHAALKRSQQDKNEELATSFGKAYDVTLKQHHNFLVKGAFSVSLVTQSLTHSLTAD